MSKKNRCFLSLLSASMFSVLLMSCGPAAPSDGIVPLRLSIIWNGLSSMQPEGKTDNRIAKIVTRETQTLVTPNFVNGNENENLVRIFATGKNMPDMIMAPYWGGGDACSDTIRRAAKDGMIVPIDEYLEEHAPNLVDAFTTGVAKNFIDVEMGVEEFRGKKYIIPMHTPASSSEMQNWGYTVYGRKDILEALDVDPSTINTSQDIYDLAVQIKNGNFKDINGNPVIPASCWANGWSYETYLNSFKDRSFTNVVNKGDHLEWKADQEFLTEEVKFMQKMVSEGLFDKTAFSHSENVALSKHTTGQVALTSAHYPYIKNALEERLYKTNPEMEYIPLGPIRDYNGNNYMPETLQEKGGYYGFAVMMISKDCKNVEAVMRYLNFLNSEEGRYLAYLGEKDVDYTVDETTGKVKMTHEFFAKEEEDPNYAYNQGIDSYFTFGVSRVPFNTFSEAREEESDATYDAVKAMYPIKECEGVLATAYDEEFANIDYFHSVLESVNYQKTIESAYCAATEADALKKLNDYRTAIHHNGYLDDYLSWLYTKLNGRADILY